jgi:hypothetical protein
MADLQTRMNQTAREILELDLRIKDQYNQYNLKGTELRSLLQEETTG